MTDWLTEGLDVPTRVAAFEILGDPYPQGSKSVFNGHAVEGTSKTGRAKHKTWRAAVVETCRDHAPPTPHDGPLELQVTFRLAQPSNRRKADRLLAAMDGSPSTVKPDLDKLIRGLLDGMTQGGLIRDDARVHLIIARKVEVIGWTGAQVWLDGAPA